VALVTVSVMALSVRVITMSAMSMGVVSVSSVSVRVVTMAMVIVTVMIVAGCEESVSCVVVGHVSECSVLDVPTEKPFLRKRSRILYRVDSPAEIASEKERTLLVNCCLLLQVVLE